MPPPVSKLLLHFEACEWSWWDLLIHAHSMRRHEGGLIDHSMRRHEGGLIDQTNWRFHLATLLWPHLMVFQMKGWIYTVSSWDHPVLYTMFLGSKRIWVLVGPTWLKKRSNTYLYLGVKRQCIQIPQIWWARSLSSPFRGTIIQEDSIRNVVCHLWAAGLNDY